MKAVVSSVWEEALHAEQALHLAYPLATYPSAEVVFLEERRKALYQDHFCRCTQLLRKAL
jgi:hypothetical protein